MTIIPSAATKAQLTDEQRDVVAKIVSKFLDLQIDATFVPPVTVGPVVSLYRFLPNGRTRVSHLESLADDFAVALGAEDILVRRRTGDSAVSIAVPNKERKPVDFRDYVGTVQKIVSKTPMHVPFAIGVDEFGTPVVEDLTALPHVLIGGATNAGKSVLLKAIIGTDVYIMNSRDVSFVISDLKGVDFNFLDGVPHLLYPPARTAMESLERMQWIVDTIRIRLDMLSKADKDNIHQYNEWAVAVNMPKMSYIVLVIDELADLMRSGGKVAKELLAQIVERSRAVGTHVIAATQRPSVDVVAGIIKANFPTRLALKTATNADSRVILDEVGAEHLIIPGDMLYRSSLRSGMIRCHSPFARKEDVKAAIEYAKAREAGAAV